MRKDPIVEEVRKVRKEIEAECGNDWGKLMAHFKKVQDRWPGKVVPPKPPRPRRPRGVRGRKP